MKYQSPPCWKPWWFQPSRAADLIMCLGIKWVRDYSMKIWLIFKDFPHHLCIFKNTSFAMWARLWWERSCKVSRIHIRAVCTLQLWARNNNSRIHVLFVCKYIYSYALYALCNSARRIYTNRCSELFNLIHYDNFDIEYFPQYFLQGK